MFDLYSGAYGCFEDPDYSKEGICFRRDVSLQCQASFLDHRYSYAGLNNSNFELKLVIGNTSGNMDSTVGAMCMAYYLTLKTGELWTPVINS